MGLSARSQTSTSRLGLTAARRRVRESEYPEFGQNQKDATCAPVMQNTTKTSVRKPFRRRRGDLRHATFGRQQRKKNQCSI